MFGNMYISLGDVIKLLLYSDIDYIDYAEKVLLGTSSIVNFFMRCLKAILTEVLSNGRCYVPLRYMLPFSLLASINNLFHNKELNVNVYWMELRRMLNVAYRRLLA